MKSGLNNAIFKTNGSQSDKDISVDTNFPFQVFPKIIQEIILDLNTNQGFIVDYTASAMIYAISVAIGNTYKIEFKRDWTQSALVYIALNGPAGSAKTHPLKWVLKPIIKKDKEEQLKYNQEYFKYQECIQKLSKDDDSIYESPKESRLQINNSTIEKIPKIHSENPRGLGYYSQELMNFIGNLNRYNNGDNLPYWLENFDNTTRRTDTVKEITPLNYYEQYISIIGSIQTEICFDMLKGNRKYNGFFERWLYTMPTNQNFAQENDREIKLETINNWNKILNRILDIPFEVGSNPILLKFSPEAKNKYLKWQHKNANIITQKNDETLAKIQKKIQQYTKRLALIFEILEWSCNQSSKTSISLNAVNSAIKVSEYFRKNAIIIYNEAKRRNLEKGNSNKVENKNLLFELLPESFQTSDAIELVQKGKINISERTVNNYLNDKNLYNCLGHGLYQKNRM